jgi:hypothetical protein
MPDGIMLFISFARHYILREWIPLTKDAGSLKPGEEAQKHPYVFIECLGSNAASPEISGMAYRSFIVNLFTVFHTFLLTPLLKANEEAFCKVFGSFSYIGELGRK